MEELDRIAQKQWGLVSTEQLYAHGWRKGRITTAIGRGRLISVPSST